MAGIALTDFFMLKLIGRGGEPLPAWPVRAKRPATADLVTQSDFAISAKLLPSRHNRSSSSWRSEVHSVDVRKANPLWFQRHNLYVYPRTLAGDLDGEQSHDLLVIDEAD